jgi:N-acyl-phosphatidylethanolamine-hydrolysing phospholipase D
MLAKRTCSVLAFVLIAATAGAPRAGLALGPAPRDDDGRFQNIAGPLERAGALDMLPFLLRRVGRMLRPQRALPETRSNDGAFLRENARHSAPMVTWIGHATLLVQMDHVTFLTDPIWSERASPLGFAGPKRFQPPGVALADLPPIDFVLISHNHYDHLDLDTLEALAERGPETRFLVPLGNAELLRSREIERVEELDWGESLTHEGVRVHCLPAQHWSQRGVGDERRALWSSWAVTGTDRRFYYAGDTGYFAGFGAIGSSLGPFDLAAVPIGAYLPVQIMQHFHVNPEQAALASRELRARRTLGIHFGTFDLADEPLDEPPVRFRAAAGEQGFAPDDVWILAVGETRGF